MSLTAVIIPCYNEEKRLSTATIGNFLHQYNHFHFILINDGSTDGTAHKLQEIKSAHPLQVDIINHESNSGKGAAIRAGILSCKNQQDKFQYVAYWDADLSTDLEELLRITKYVSVNSLDYAFGSRMKKLNSDIQRSAFRHYIGRVVTTIVDSHFNLGIYDTQCGAKIFTTALAGKIAEPPFVTTWLFDVEIFLRILAIAPKPKGEEIPLYKWKSQKGSKINVLSAPRVIFEFIKLVRCYPVKPVNNES